MRRKSKGGARHVDPELLARVRQALDSPLFEGEPMADDILPDQIRRFADVPEADEEGLTARPRDASPLLHPEELPAG